MDRALQLVQQAAKYLDAENISAAEQAAREVLAVDPRNINGLRLMGAVTRKQGLPERSLEYFTDALSLNDKKAVLHFELGTAYTELHRSEEAYQCYYRAVQLDPTLQVAFVNLSAVMEQHQRYEEAIDWAQRAIALNPACGLAHYNLANAQRELGQLTEAIGNYRQALRYKPGHEKTHWNMALCQLLAGNFREGWRLFEYRRAAGEVFFDAFPQPRWDGSSLAGKTIVIHAEQGIGDEVLFATCFADVIDRAKHCVIVCDPRLQRIFARSFPTTTVHGWLRRKDWSPPALTETIDVQIPSGSLPLHFRLSAESFPRQQRFLTVDPQLHEMWRRRLNSLGDGLKIGISWRAGGKPIESRKRTVPLDRWRDIFTVPGARFVNLQYGDASAEIAAAQAKFGVEIHDWEDGDPLVDVDSFAAKIAALDLVISVGNATVHLAGAVGTEAWTLLPMIPSWRWMAAGEESPWYGAVRLYRQPGHGQWRPVLNRVARMLRERTGAGMAPMMPHAGEHDSEPVEQSAATDSTTSWTKASDIGSEKPGDLIARLIAEAQRHEAAGELAQAETGYREVLQLAPRQITALNGLGIVARKTGRPELAIRSFRRSLAMIDALPEHQLNLADALADTGRFEEALACYLRGLTLNEMQPAAHLQTARMLTRLGRPTEAEPHLRRTLKLAPDYAEALVELGLNLIATCRIDEAFQYLERALGLSPNLAVAHNALGRACLEDQRAADAERYFRRASELDPSLAGVEVDLGRALRLLGRNAEAVPLYEMAVERTPNDVAALVQLAILRRELGDSGAAADLLRMSVLLRPADPQILNLMGTVLDELGESADALDCFDDAVRFAPQNADAHLNRGFALLKSGRLAEGWSEYQWRWQCQAAGRSPTYLSQSRWDGSDLAGKSILVYGEQALVDEIMFASCYPDVVQRAAQCIIACDPRLETIFRRSFPQAQVAPVVRGREQHWRPPVGLKIDAQVYAGDLPKLLRTTLESFPDRHQYLATDERTVALWRERFASLDAGVKVGIDWQAESESRSSDRQANYVELLKALADVPGLTLIDISGTRPPASAEALMSELGIAIHRSSAINSPLDVDSLAAQITNLDLVVSRGGIAGHIAGALGIPAMVLLENSGHWRWFGASADRVAWYPRSRVYRTTRSNSSTEPVAKLRQDLLDLLPRVADEQGMRGVSGPHWGHRASRQNAK